jgi:ABC-type dipeptide/oligopeptide/nickel transport system permease subunit
MPIHDVDMQLARPSARTGRQFRVQVGEISGEQAGKDVHRSHGRQLGLRSLHARAGHVDPSPVRFPPYHHGMPAALAGVDHGAHSARPGGWRDWGIAERCALAILALCVLIGLAGSRWWWITDPGTGALHRVSLIELVSGSDADGTNPPDRLLPPGAHLADGTRTLLGTDELGRSLALGLACALGASITVACSAAVIALVIGTLWGTVAALVGGRWDSLLMRFAEVTAAVPNVVVIVVVVSALKNLGSAVTFAAMGLLYWQTISRVVRARVLRLRSEAYVEASRAMGAGAWHRIRLHLLPGIAPTVLAYGALLLPRLIMLESLLSYLGVSSNASAAHSFGRIIAGVTSTLTPLSRSWWPILMPCLVLSLFLLALNMVLDALASRDDRSH